jgi:hypothetical protein
VTSRKLVALGLFAAAAAVGAQPTGVISGVVRTAAGPVSNARALLDGTRENRTDSTGRFRFNVPAGRHTLEVLSIGTVPYKVDVMVPAGDTISFDVILEKIVVLDSMLIEGSTVRQGFVRDYLDRKKLGLGRYIDSSQVRSFAKVPQAVSFVPGVRYKNGIVKFSSGGGDCMPNVWIDRVNFGIDQGELGLMRPDDIMAIEVYTRGGLVPEEFRPRGREKGCGALVIWTRRLWPQGKGKPR